ncbi:MAG: hypothetical protein COT73_07580 [Bdellovibrio sp. CG10_big_fil_rev_8_21_14_0_10_47_8]|nr:MAG: hypothetical protein COT73_07580 [Bdellovibrio sp. CG10_big_fil_rev_8_21_14_0_10_47_8]
MERQINSIVLNLGMIIFLLILPSGAQAFKDGSFSAGMGYYSQNVMNKTSQAEDGSSKFLGEANYPLNLKYDFLISSNWFLAPQLSYTLFFQRKTPGDTAKVNLMHLAFLFGKNFGSDLVPSFDWYIGPGLIQYEIQGAGGTTVMNNGTSTSTFAVPGRKSTIKKITTVLGTSWSSQHVRVGLDLIFENAFSSTKRTQSLMLSCSYVFGGGFFR